MGIKHMWVHKNCPANFALLEGFGGSIAEIVPRKEARKGTGRVSNLGPLLADSTFTEHSVAKHRNALLEKFRHKLEINPSLNRSLVSFQANKSSSFYHWLKYKEAFSSTFVETIIGRLIPKNPSTIPMNLLDPFCGTGTALTTAVRLGWNATGIDLLPVGVAALTARLLATEVDINEFEHYLAIAENVFANGSDNLPEYKFPHLRITERAFPVETETDLRGYMAFLDGIPDKTVRYLLWFACMSILEDISFTRKDGQFLRWDNRSGRNLKSNFHKGKMPEFWPLILGKLHSMAKEIRNESDGILADRVQVIRGSCLTELTSLPCGSFGMVITSPPYCNRYDYTRTYALELAFMGFSEDIVRELRQELLSATVENKSKADRLEQHYTSRGLKEWFHQCCEVFENQRALHEVLEILYRAAVGGQLNNSNIPKMVEYYFFEMNLVIHELARILAPGGVVVMVNDNVRYHGQEVPVDLILSDFAEKAGLKTDVIWVLPRGKGNSSQQMGKYGRAELRKCVYVWTKR